MTLKINNQSWDIGYTVRRGETMGVEINRCQTNAGSINQSWLDVGTQTCYNDHQKGGKKKVAYYKDAVKDYHAKLKDMKIRVLKENEEFGIPDYPSIFKEQATLLGKASVNEYILDLIETDIQNNGLKKKDFHIIRGMTEIEK